jgi:arylsulfatase A-like enzyme
MFLNDQSKFGHVDLYSYLGGKNSIFRPLSDSVRRNIIDLYDGEIRYTDEKLIGPLIKQLKARGLYDRTMIVFTSDHGEEFFDHGGWGHGQSLYDESLRVPLIIKFPRSLYRGRKIPLTVSLVDVMPTILKTMRVPFSESGLDGRSLIPMLEGKENKDRSFFADVGANVLDFHLSRKIAANQGRMKLILNQKPGPEDLSFFAYPPPEISAVELFDLDADPHERKNCADGNSALANRLIRRVNAVYRAAKKRRTEKVRIDAGLQEQLKALGYIK